MHARISLATVLALLLSGCIADLMPGDWYNTRPYRVADANTPAGRAIVAGIIAQIAAQLRFQPADAPSDVPGVFALPLRRRR
jgi:hypothetical protein